MKKVLIIGGGFAGISCALELSKKASSDVKITLVSDKSHFEYHAALYRVVTGRSPFHVCIPLAEIFAGTDVEIVEDTITDVNLSDGYVLGHSGSKFSYDYLVLALGSQSEYFGIEGAQENSLEFKSIQGAMRLKRHLHEVMSMCGRLKKDARDCAATFVVIGGGANGVELAAELSIYTKAIASAHFINPEDIRIELIEASSRVLTAMPEQASLVVQKRLEGLGVKLNLNKLVVKSDVDEILVTNDTIRSKTLIWTAGIKANSLYSEIDGLKVSSKGRVLVNDLVPSGFDNVFILGDAAETQYSGMAPTAVYDGKFAAAKILGEQIEYSPSQPVFAVPVGPGWAYVLKGNSHFYGKLGWFYRKKLDLDYFRSILPFTKALTAYKEGARFTENCPICSQT